MSRIHDALKRAEQERATSMGTYVEPAFDQPDVQRDVQRENLPSLQPSGANLMPTMTSGFTYESLDSRCPQGMWTPDPRTMLFFQNDYSRVRADAFRTRRSRLCQLSAKMRLKRLRAT